MLKPLLIIFLFAVSCGVRDDSSEQENKFKGSWRVDSILCFFGAAEGVAIDEFTESYTIDQFTDIIFNFESLSFEYSVRATCNVDTSGTAEVTFATSVGTGVLRLSNLVGGSLCSLDLEEDFGAGSSSIDFNLSSASNLSLNWSYGPGNSIRLSMPNEFLGSSDFSYCDESCECQLVLNKI